MSLTQIIVLRVGVTSPSRPPAEWNWRVFSPLITFVAAGPVEVTPDPVNEHEAAAEVVAWAGTPDWRHDESPVFCNDCIATMMQAGLERGKFIHQITRGDLAEWSVMCAACKTEFESE